MLWLKYIIYLIACQIWDRINAPFNESCSARVYDLKDKLANLVKHEGQSMDDCLRGIKVIVDSLASIQSPIPDKELIDYTIQGLNEVYEPLLAVVLYSKERVTFDKFHYKLIQYEERVLFLHNRNDNPHAQVFAASTIVGQSAASASGGQSHGGGSLGGNVVKGRGNGNRRNGRKGGRVNNANNGG